MHTVSNHVDGRRDPNVVEGDREEPPDVPGSRVSEGRRTEMHHKIAVCSPLRHVMGSVTCRGLEGQIGD